MISTRMAIALTTLLAVAPAVAQVEVTEATIAELQEAMETGRATSAEITAAYLARIAAYDRGGPRLGAMIRINPNALAEAESLDHERAARGSRGVLHGIPIILKDNYATFDMVTSAGSLALSALRPPADAFQVRRLREAGAVIVGKANMDELASGYVGISSLGGQTLNPYDLTRIPGGSSGGTGASIAASYAAVGWGSDTCGSIRVPASHNNLVGLRATKGLSSIAGILPLSHTQDVGGPLARTVEDLAIALDATIGPDPADPATSALGGRP
ncbi:MAG TPA: amidase family protein, partial [Longimicrobiaceae bacterium]|nr:amidase family protein [Longimicrobiaceae bacterium]